MLGSIAPEVTQERWADENILLLLKKFEVCPVPTDSDCRVGRSIMDMSHDREHDVLLELLRSGGGIHLATLRLRARVTVLTEEVKDEALPEDVHIDWFVRVGNPQSLTEPLQWVVVPCP